MSYSAGSSKPLHVPVPTAGSEREEFIAMLRAIRNEGVPKVVQMMQALEHEATHAKRDTARVAATRAYLNNAFQATRELHEIEQGIEGQPRTGPAVQILVAMPSGESRSPNGQELKAIMAEISDSVRAEITASSDED